MSWRRLEKRCSFGRAIAAGTTRKVFPSVVVLILVREADAWDSSRSLHLTKCCAVVSDFGDEPATNASSLPKNRSRNVVKKVSLL